MNNEDYIITKMAEVGTMVNDESVAVILDWINNGLPDVNAEIKAKKMKELEELEAKRIVIEKELSDIKKK